MWLAWEAQPLTRSHWGTRHPLKLELLVPDPDWPLAAKGKLAVTCSKASTCVVGASTNGGRWLRPDHTTTINNHSSETGQPAGSITV